MSISLEQLQLLLQQQQQQYQQQQQQMLASQQKLLETLLGKLSIQQEIPEHKSIESYLNPVSEFIFDADNGHTFEAWFGRIEDIFRVEFAAIDDAKKVRLLLQKLGPNEHQKYKNHILPKHPREVNFDETVNILNKMFCEQSSLFRIRYNCLQLTKGADEDYTTYAGRVNLQAERFKLNVLTSDQFKCLLFISGLNSPVDADFRMKLLSRMEHDDEMTLQTITTECQRLINLKQDTAMLETKSAAPSNSVHAVKTGQRRNSTKSHKYHSKSPKPATKCWYCGAWHFSRFCRFRNHRCTICNKVGHKELVCRTRESLRSKRTRRPHQYENKYINSVYSTLALSVADKRRYVELIVNGVHIRLQLDTASDITLISKRTWYLIGCPKVLPTEHTARNASGDILKLVGMIKCSVKFRGNYFTGNCYLTNRHELDLIGIDWIDKLNLWDVPLNEICTMKSASNPRDPPTVHVTKKVVTIEDLLQKHKNLFQNKLGCCTIEKAKLYLRQDVKPVFRPKRQVPYAAIDKVDKELDRLEKLGVIQPVNYSAWAAPIVVVQKASGAIRLCADFSTGLNDVLQNHSYPLPLPEDLFIKLNGGRYFSKLDLSEAYLQVEVDEDSKELLTINTHRGLYRFNRLPFGVKPAPAIFQQIMDTMVSNIEGVAVYLDDIIVVGSSTQELMRRLDVVLTKISQAGFQLQKEKCEFLLESVKYLGYIFDKDGRRPDPDNINAIKNMPRPTEVTTLRSFLGMIGYYSMFVPQMYKLRQPLNQLLMANTTWHWTKECQDSFDEIKRILSSKLLLTHYNPKLEIIVAADASNYGIGAVISHRFPDGKEKPIAHASRTLNSAERKYSQIEKEGLALVFAVKKFHKMIYGRRFTLLTDHKPLISIFGSKSGIPAYTANRLQRWAITLLAYDFQILYKSTEKFGQADALSRLIANQKQEREDSIIATISLEDDIHHILQVAIKATPLSSEDIRRYTQEDDELKQIISYLEHGWPAHIDDKNIEQYSHRRNSLSLVDGCLMFGNRVIVPINLRCKVMSQLHAAHPGVARMKALARGYVYWPNIDAQIKEYVERCSACAKAIKAPRKTEMQSWGTPTNPWSRVHVDFAGPINGKQYLVMVDAFSKWPEIHYVKSLSTKATIEKLRQVFSCFGCPDVLVSDNGPQFTSAEFSKFCAANAVRHIKTPPYHPQSNGLVERFVDTFKRALLKAEGEGEIDEMIQRFLQTYRATPNPTTNNQESPAEAIFGRKIRIPMEQMKPKLRANLRKNKRMEQQFNKRHGALPRRFKVGQAVITRDFTGVKPTWKFGIIIRKKGKVIYEVEVGQKIWVRHANQIQPTRQERETEIATKSKIPINILTESNNEIKNDPNNNKTCETLPRRSQRIRRKPNRIKINPKDHYYL
ncbi:unnamed protein product [Schistosoma haematobium]|nr:unnamed protein product [Schistosoma haematobium]CAH8670757.1 unnamed protein product [Schistosoma haematobium]CAH8675710.1 unnamed protein product [Schistosoma haematobium]CAH8675715.1 unnamed protein product [Schistosoma haematobium]